MANDILKTLIAEAYGEGPEGMRLVAETILNRAAIRGLTPEQVVKQKHQYTGLRSPGPEAKKAWNNPEAVAAAEAAWQLAQQPGDPTGGADHYYAPGTISQPWWAKSMTPKGEMGGHAFFASRPIPPGELPQVATALSTVPTPRAAPTPTTPSIDMAQMRRIRAPSQLIPDTFAGLSRPSRTLADDIAMSPIPGGRQSAPMFDAAYDERVGAMRQTRQPMDTQGMAVARSRAPAPIPALPSPQLAARRATDPQLQASLNARYPAQLPPLPPPSGQGPSTRRVATTTIRPSASDLVRGNPMQTREDVTTIASIPTRQRVSASDLARGRSGISTVASIPTTGLPTTAQILNGTAFRGGGPVDAPERLVAGLPGMPELYGNGGIGGVGGRAVAPVPFMRPASFGSAPMPPLPIARPRVAPVPFDRPNFGMGGPERRAPIPAPRSQRPGLFRIAGFELPQLPTQARSVAGRTSMIDAPLAQAFNGGGRQNTAAVQSYRNEGLSASQAYDAANRASVERAIANARDPEAARRLNSR